MRTLAYGQTILDVGVYLLTSLKDKHAVPHAAELLYRVHLQRFEPPTFGSLEFDQIAYPMPPVDRVVGPASAALILDYRRTVLLALLLEVRFNPRLFRLVTVECHCADC